MPIIELPNRFVDSLEKPEKIERVYYAETPHRMDTNWIMVSQGTIDTFSPWEIALIKEAVSSLIAYNDNSILEQERQAFLALCGKFQIVS